MTKEKRKTRQPSKRVLSVIVDGLEEIRAYFGWSPPSTANGHVDPDEDLTGATSSHSGRPTGDDDGEEGDDEDHGDADRDDEGYDEEYDDSDDEYSEGYVDREEIEIAVDAFISTLIDADIVRKNHAGKPPSFAGVFGRFFGSQHEITKKAEEFEKYIEGYGGWISPEEIQNAESSLLEIYEIVQTTLKGGRDGR
jgi:hypothetical protein